MTTNPDPVAGTPTADIGVGRVLTEEAPVHGGSTHAERTDDVVHVAPQVAGEQHAVSQLSLGVSNMRQRYDNVSRETCPDGEVRIGEGCHV